MKIQRLCHLTIVRIKCDQIYKRDNFRFSAKEREKERKRFFSRNISLSLYFWSENMAGLSRGPTKAWCGTRRESLECTNEVESLATNEEFIQKLIKLPEELIRLKNENERLKKESKASCSR